MRAKLVCSLLFLFLLGGFDSFAANSKGVCNAIARIDFKNATIDLDEYQAQFKDGKYDAFEDGESGKSYLEWRFTIEEDVILSPNPNFKVRVLDISKDHYGGTGDWIYTVAYVCEKGQLKRVHEEKHDYGGGFKKISESEIQVDYSEWKEEDPHCCPSIYVSDLYQWSASKSAFDLLKRTKSNKKDEPADATVKKAPKAAPGLRDHHPPSN